MGQIDVRQSAKINASADKAWEAVGPQFLNIAAWARGVERSWDNEALAKSDGAPAGGRFCQVGAFGQVNERIVHYDHDAHEISWVATAEKIPGFVKDLRNDLKVEAIDENTCRISTHLTANATGIMGLLMGPMMRKNFTKLLRGFIEDWKAYAETGSASVVKQKELARPS